LKRFPEIFDKYFKYFKKGPSAPFLDGIKRYRVYYRTRPRGTHEWKKWAIEMTLRSEADARYRTIQQCRDHGEVEVVRVVEVAAEAPIQTGQSVQTVSASEYERIQQETMDLGAVSISLTFDQRPVP
jgi:hypothetical protein